MLAGTGKLTESTGRLKDGVGGRVPGAEVAVASHVASWALQAASARALASIRSSSLLCFRGSLSRKKRRLRKGDLPAS